MIDHDVALLAFAKLAEISKAKQQLLPCDKFLVLAGAEACRAGYPRLAARCRELVLGHNHAHLLKRFSDFPAALADADFQTFLKQLARFCPLERAELLLQQLDIDVRALAAAENANLEIAAADLLQGPVWDPVPS